MTRTLPPELTAYTAEEIAEHLGVSAQTISKAIREGNLKAVRIGMKYFVSYDHYREFLNVGMGGLKSRPASTNTAENMQKARAVKGAKEYKETIEKCYQAYDACEEAKKVAEASVKANLLQDFKSMSVKDRSAYLKTKIEFLLERVKSNLRSEGKDCDTETVYTGAVYTGVCAFCIANEIPYHFILSNIFKVMLPPFSSALCSNELAFKLSSAFSSAGFEHQPITAETIDCLKIKNVLKDNTPELHFEDVLLKLLSDTDEDEFNDPLQVKSYNELFNEKLTPEKLALFLSVLKQTGDREIIESFFNEERP